MLETVIWLGVAGACVLAVIWAGPYHQRIIDSRPKIAKGDDWD